MRDDLLHDPAKGLEDRVIVDRRRVEVDLLDLVALGFDLIVNGLLDLPADLKFLLLEIGITSPITNLESHHAYSSSTLCTRI